MQAMPQSREVQRIGTDGYLSLTNTNLLTSNLGLDDGFRLVLRFLLANTPG